MKEALSAGEPAISVDAKKKELIGDFRNGGREWRPQGSPEQVRVHDFVIPEFGRAVPCGVYDIANNAGSVMGRMADSASSVSDAPPVVSLSASMISCPRVSGLTQHGIGNSWCGERRVGFLRSRCWNSTLLTLSGLLRTCYAESPRYWIRRRAAILDATPLLGPAEQG